MHLFLRIMSKCRERFPEIATKNRQHPQGFCLILFFMNYTVYADVLFLVNWLMDFALLWATAAVLDLQRGKGRIALAAAVGAAWVCLIAIYPIWPAAEWILTFFGVSSLMLWIAFRPAKIRGLLRQLGVLYCVAILAGGGINLFYFHTPAGNYVKQLIRGETELKAAEAGVMIGAVIAVIVTAKALSNLGKQRRRQNSLYRAKLFFGKQQVTVQGFIDTGNRLKEPITGKAVHIIQAEAAKLLTSEEEKPMSFLVPYHAVGTENGLLTAIRIDRMELTAKDSSRIVIERPLLGLYDGKISSNEEYQLILHAETKTGQGEIV